MPPRSSSAAGFPSLKVQFYRRMKPNRVYPLTVAWSEKPKPVGAIKNVTVRLLGAGAQIVPSEQALDATRPELKATFFVTPLAKGWLRAQRIEVLVQGRKVQEIPVASKVVCQCWSGFWFILAFLLPMLLIWLRSADSQFLANGIRTHVPDLPALIADSAPSINDAWNQGWEWLAEGFARFSQFNKDRLLAFPLSIGLLLLSLWSLLRNRDRTKYRVSEPIAIPAGIGE